MRKEILIILALGLTVPSFAQEKIEIVETTASAVFKEDHTSNAVDGVVSDKSRWVGGKDENGKIWLRLQLKQEGVIAGIQLHSGYGNGSAIESFYVEIKNDSGEWEKVPGSTVTKNKSTKRTVPFSAPVSFKELRIVVTKTEGDIARVKEVVCLSNLPSLAQKVDLKNLDIYPKLITQKLGGSTVNIDPEGFRFSFSDEDGKVIALANEEAGLRIDNEAAHVSSINSNGSYNVVTESGKKATVSLSTNNGKITFKLKSDSALGKTSLVLGDMPVAYGLGDAGWRNSYLNLIGSKNKSYHLKIGAGKDRWVSSFVVFPLNKLAGVVLQGKPISVTLGPKTYAMNINAKKEATFHYFIGDMNAIYKNYRSLLDLHDYPKIRPKFRLFELGWESWAALGYQTNAEAVLKSVQQFQKDGYQVRWAVTGSGFWEQGGTTTSFGQFGKKFPDPKGFKKTLNDADVKWMIGLRTNFVLPGGPHIPKSKKRDYNLKAKTFNGNPISNEGLEKGYFIMRQPNEPLLLTSPYFPIVPSYMLDGRNPEAVKWYADLYKKWGVDGIKEDTMMNVGSSFIDIYNQPVAQIAKDGALVMARCGSFSSPGTLQRINDTKPNDVKRRTPITYLQYAASAAPNVYSDTVGFRSMKSYSKTIIAQAWLTSLTAGMAVAERPSKWSKDQQKFYKKPIDFHYAIGPMLYDAAVKSYESGFPYTMTPLALAFPGDKQATEIYNFQWMIGESLLCTPQLRNPEKETLDIYLPKGYWIDYDTGKKYQGPQLLKDFAMPVDKTPCFVGGKGIVVLRSSDDAPLSAHVYPVDQEFNTYVFTHPDGKSTSILKFEKAGQRGVRNTDTEEPVPFSTDAKSGAISFDIAVGQSYSFTF